MDGEESGKNIAELEAYFCKAYKDEKYLNIIKKINMEVDIDNITIEEAQILFNYLLSNLKSN